MMDNLTYITRYFNHLAFAKTKYYLHSPFVYDLMVNVIQDDRHFYAYDEINDFRTSIFRSKKTIEVNEQGAGSRKMGNTRSIKQIAKVASITPKKGKLLFRLINYFNCKNILELGTSIGLGTIYLAKANLKNNITTIEACRNTLEIAKEHFEKLGLQNVNAINSTFSNYLKENTKKEMQNAQNTQNGQQFDLVYIDGDHKKESTLNYFVQLLHLKKESTIFVFDDINWSIGMYEAWQQIKEHPEVTISVDLFQLSIVFFKKDLAKQHFQLYF